MRNLIASFISLQALLTLFYWGFILKCGGFAALVLPVLWIWGAIQIARLAIKQSDFDLFIWWFAYLDMFLLYMLICLIVVVPLIVWISYLTLPGIVLALISAFYLSEKKSFLHKPTFENHISEIFLKLTAILPLLPVLLVSSMGS